MQVGCQRDRSELSPTAETQGRLMSEEHSSAVNAPPDACSVSCAAAGKAGDECDITGCVNGLSSEQREPRGMGVISVPMDKDRFRDDYGRLVRFVGVSTRSETRFPFETRTFLIALKDGEGQRRAAESVVDSLFSSQGIDYVVADRCTDDTGRESILLYVPSEDGLVAVSLLGLALEYGHMSWPELQDMEILLRSQVRWGGGSLP